MALLDEAASLASLQAALDRVARNRAGPGPDGVTIEAFSRNARDELTRLQEDLLSGAWSPRPARRIRIAKPGGGHRNLALSAVRDRVVQHALAATLASALDAALHPFAWAWRRGRATRDALAVVDEALAEGNAWVFRGDIEEFFDRLAPKLLLATLDEVTAEPPLVRVVEKLLAAGVLVGAIVHDAATGTGQGSPLSPFLANLYLVPFDTAMEREGFTMVRYGDDLCVPGFVRDEVTAARDCAAAALARLRLALNPHKLEVRHRGEGFVFLGFQFDAAGRRPSDRARRTLGEKLDAVLRERPADAREEVDDLLRGWLAYYGSLAGVALPAAVRERAEALASTHAERAQFGPLPARAAAPPDAPATSSDNGRRSSLSLERPPDPAGASRWADAATRLRGAAGTDDEPAVREALRASLGLAPEPFAELAAALARFDGRAAAEVLARAGRFGDASEVEALAPPTAVPADATTAPRGLPVRPEDAEERPRWDPHAGDAERLLELFGGAEHVFFRDVVLDGKVQRERVLVRPSSEHARAHLDGTFWMGVYPLRANNSVRFAAVRVTAAAKVRRGPSHPGITEAVTDDARRLADAVRALGLAPVHSIEPGRARVVWVLFEEAVTGARARTLLDLVLRRAGALDPSLTREVLPAQETAKPDKPGTGILFPLGRDGRTGERGWFCDDTLTPVPDPCGWLRGLAGNAGAKVAEALGVRPKLPVAPAVARPKPAASRGEGTTPEAPAVPVAVAAATSPFRELPRAQEVYQGCSVARHYVDQAIAGRGLATSERFFLAEVLGRLGNEAVGALDAVYRHLDDFRPGMGARFVQRLYPHPISCGRVREKLPELTARVGCDCRFRVPPGAYPTPVLHAMGAAQVPGMGERVAEAATRGALARAAVASMNEGRKELGVKAAALCTRLSDLRRQVKVLEKTIAKVESELDAVMDEAGDATLETPAGTLRRVKDDAGRRFVLDV